MGMKPPANESQSQLAGNLVSGPKETSSYGSGDYDSSGLVSSSKPTPEHRSAMPGNVLISGGSGGDAKKPG